MRRIIFTILVLFFSGNILSQDLEIVTKKNEGIFNITEAGYLPGVGNISYDGDLKSNEGEAYRFRTLFGYFITPRFSVGLGTGIDAYRSPSYNTLPVFADVRAYLHDSRNSSFAYVDLGRSFSGSEFQKGMFFNFGVGFKYFVSERICLNTSLGYNYQRMYPEKLYVNDVLNIGYRDEIPSNFKSLSVNVGIIFELWAIREPTTDLSEEYNKYID